MCGGLCSVQYSTVVQVPVQWVVQCTAVQCSAVQCSVQCSVQISRVSSVQCGQYRAEELEGSAVLGLELRRAGDHHIGH